MTLKKCTIIFTDVTASKQLVLIYLLKICPDILDIQSNLYKKVLLFQKLPNSIFFRLKFEKPPNMF